MTINDLINRDIFNYLFSFFSPEENMVNAQVCKLWHDIAQNTVKIELISLFKKTVEEKSKGFLRMISQPLERFYPKYSETLTTLEKNKTQLTVAQVHKKLNKLISEKKLVHLAGCFIVDPSSPNIPSERQNDLAGKAFVEFHYRKEEQLDGKDEADKKIHIWGDNEVQIIYFPIELFNLKIEENMLIGEKNSGEFCFILKGRLVQLTLDPGTRDVIESCFSFPCVNNESISIVQLSPEDSLYGRIWARNIYVPRLETTSPNEKSTNAES